MSKHFVRILVACRCTCNSHLISASDGKRGKCYGATFGAGGLHSAELGIRGLLLLANGASESSSSSKGSSYESAACSLLTWSGNRLWRLLQMRTMYVMRNMIVFVRKSTAANSKTRS